MSTRYNAPDQDGVLHYVTLNVRDKKLAFRDEFFARLALDELRFECDRHPAKLLAYVVMPDHLHLLANFEDGKVSRFLARFKPAVTKKLDALALTSGKTRVQEWLCEKGKRELWQDSKHSAHIWSETFIAQKIAYIHSNPVRKGLVENALDYPWSSIGAHFPEAGISAPIRVDLEWWFD